MPLESKVILNIAAETPYNPSYYEILYREDSDPQSSVLIKRFVASNEKECFENMYKWFQTWMSEEEILTHSDKKVRAVGLMVQLGYPNE